jgi:pimeloyl-ACP methyl ester carboxylesterase
MLKTRVRRPIRAIGGCALLAANLLCCLPSAAAALLDCRVIAPGTGSAVVITQLAGVPAILRIPKVIAKPPIILWHGFGPPADPSTLMAALPLDDVPAVKVYLGLPLFGLRSPPGRAAEMIRRQAQDFASLVFEPVVIGAARELPAVVSALRERHCLRAGQGIGLFGFSAGGAAALIALAQRKVHVDAAVTLNASTGLTASVEALEHATTRPYSWTRHARVLAKLSDAARHAAQIAGGRPPSALLLIHGADDQTVSPAATVALYRKLLPYYRAAGAESRLQLIVAPGLSHSWSRVGNSAHADADIAAWLNRFLPESAS